MYQGTVCTDSQGPLYLPFFLTQYLKGKLKTGTTNIKQRTKKKPPVLKEKPIRMALENKFQSVLNSQLQMHKLTPGMTEIPMQEI